MSHGYRTHQAARPHQGADSHRPLPHTDACYLKYVLYKMEDCAQGHLTTAASSSGSLNGNAAKAGRRSTGFYYRLRAYLLLS
ncbi:hypothetical protein CHARACLAT_006778 [Characodon lateralis]|uniref:Uncharacterized protein n=1 Tax=Characodon lateralis TaxID=208331 RepID=A0ABU7DG77_9TELE|nr:hypothetical protein [Characodon lateralis]